MSDVAWLGDNVVRVVDWLREHPGLHRPPEIAEATRLHPNHIYRYCRRALQYGYALNPARGLYESSDWPGEVRTTVGRHPFR